MIRIKYYATFFALSVYHGYEKILLGDAKKNKKHPLKLKPLDQTQKNGDIDTFKQPKRDRENFRKALVEIIMCVLFYSWYLKFRNLKIK